MFGQFPLTNGVGPHLKYLGIWTAGRVVAEERVGTGKGRDKGQTLGGGLFGGESFANWENVDLKIE